MKKILIVAIMATSLVACKSNSNEVSSEKDIIILGDSSKLIPGSSLTDTALLITTNADGTTSSEAVVPGAQPKAAVAKPATKARTSSTTSTGSSSTGTTTSSSTGTNTTTQKTGISKAAKGAIIGGVGGAAAGAVIGRNAKGAAVGAAVGAAGGYIIGRSKDKKDGRNQ